MEGVEMKAKQKRPTIGIDGPADRRSKGCERIAEFRGSSGKGGMISVREKEDGTMQVWLFNVSPGTTIICRSPETVMVCPSNNHLPWSPTFRSRLGDGKR
jgi:hypothetical protein